MRFRAIASKTSLWAGLLIASVAFFTCHQQPPPAGGRGSGELTISEVVSNNEGAWLDEHGEADDFLELTNTAAHDLELSHYLLQDGEQRIPLPHFRLKPNQALLIWADEQAHQGALHLPFRLSSGGERIRLLDQDQLLVDDVRFGPLGVNEAFARFGGKRGAFSVCRYASAGQPNPESCEPPAPPSLQDESFAPYSLPDPYRVTSSRVLLSELALKPAAFIEIYNDSDEPVTLSDYALWIASHGPGAPWPVAGTGSEVELPEVTLTAGQRISVPVPSTALTTLESDPLFEGVVSLFEQGRATPADRVDFMHWPEDATLTRMPDAGGPLVFCSNTTPGAVNTCDAVPSRETGDRVRYLRTPGDFHALATGDPSIGVESVKFVLDLKAGGVVHLLSSERYALHYTFVREQIYEEPELDRCDPEENAEFYQGWVDFSVTEYFQVEGRRFLLGTLSRYAGAGLQAIEYTFGDAISPEQMRLGFFSTLAHTQDPRRWVLRAQDDVQLEKVRQLEGTVPLVGPNAPFVGVSFQPLTQGVAFGSLRFIPAGELQTATFGRDTIIVTDDVPNDIPFVAGLVTEAFQTPLAHVNVLSQNRNTPNAALRNARDDERLKPHFDELVRLEVTASELSVRRATASEVTDFWDGRVVSGPTLSPRLDTSLRGVAPLEEHSLDSLPLIGAKAAQLAELKRVDTVPSGCEAVPAAITPREAFAIPLVHYLEHFERSGAKAELQRQRRHPDFDTDPKLRAQALSSVRAKVTSYPVDPALLDEVTEAVRSRFGEQRVRFRSSSNTEDLATFNGAGLYTSVSAQLGDAERPVDDALRTVWASLWNARAVDERRNANIDEEDIAMGVLVHLASLSEEANGVAVSRNVLDPNRGDIYYINVQAGEAAVTNPAPGITTDQLIYRWPPRTPSIEYNSDSSLLAAVSAPYENVLSEAEVRAVACSLAAVHDWFRPKLDPSSENRWFAMEVEFKLLDGTRQLLFKQARPHSFGAKAAASADCREF